MYCSRCRSSVRAESAPIEYPSPPAVGPDGAAATASPNQSGLVLTFWVENPNGYSESYTLLCSRTGAVSSCSTPGSVFVGAGQTVPVNVTYATGSPGSGTLSLQAIGFGSDNGSYNVTVEWGPAPTVDVTPYNFDHQDMTRCAVSCFAATYAQSTVPYVSLDTPRNVTLVYHGDRADPRPFIHVDVRHGGSTQNLPQQWRLAAKVNGATVTFVNGETELRFAAPTNLSWYRLGGQFDAVANGVSSTGMHVLQILVTAVYAGGTTTTTVNTKLLLVNESTSAIARGWTLAGIQRLFIHADSALITEGDGSAVYFRRSGTSFLRPAGEFSTLVLNQPDGSAGWTRKYPDSTKVVFSNVGRMIEVRDRFNNITKILYDGSSRVQKIQDPSHTTQAPREITLAYNANGLSSITGPFGRVTTVTVDGTNRLTQVRDPDNVSTDFTYEGTTPYRLLTIKNRRGHTTTLAYDTQSKKLATITPPAVPIYGQGTVSPVTTLLPWHKGGVPYGATSGTPFALIARDSVKATVTDPGGHVTTFTADRWGQPLLLTEPLNQRTTFTYDVNGQPVRILYPKGGSDSLAYNGDGLGTYVRPAGGTPSYVAYPATPRWGLPDSTWGTNQPRVRYFVSAGKIDSTRVGSPATGYVTRYTYDSRGRVTDVRDPVNHLLGKTWHAATNGNRSKDSLPGGRVTWFWSDRYGRDSVVQQNGLPKRTILYDVVNRPTSVNDGVNTNPTTFTYDSLYLTKVRDPRTEYVQEYRFTYNALGWLTQQTDPLNRSDVYEYSKDGELRRWTNRRAQAVTMTYDVLHRRLVTAGPLVSDTLSYPDSTGLVVRAGSPVVNETAYVNVRGQPDSVKTVMGGTTYWKRYHYRSNSNGLPDSVRAIDQSGTASFLTRHYRYVPVRGTLDSIRLGSGAWTRFGYNADRWAETTTLPNSDVITRSFTTTHRKGRISSTASHDSATGRQLEWGVVNRIKGEMNGLKGSRFGYDGLNRLVVDSFVTYQPTSCQPDPNGDLGVVCTPPAYPPDSVHAFAYDAVGNRTGGGAAYGQGNRVQSFGGCTYATDNDGNVTSRTGCGTSLNLVWRSDNRLDSLLIGSTRIKFDYDAFGRLVRRRVNGTIQSYFLWDGDNLMAELAENATKKGEYAYYPGLDNLHAFITQGVPYWAHRDGRGNVIGLTSASRTLIRSYKYDDWGNLIGGNDVQGFNNADRARFKGALWMGPEVELYYMRSRWYDPQSGRFLSEDPFGLAGGINPYVFAANDPINLRDPKGLCPTGFQLKAVVRIAFLEDGTIRIKRVLYYYCEPPVGYEPPAPEWFQRPTLGPDERAIDIAPNACPIPPVAPSGADLNRNIRRANWHRRFNPLATPWFGNQVSPGGAWDYKRYGLQYQHFGNFNYAATGRALGITAQRTLRQLGGYFQENPQPEWGSPGGDFPYGDDPIDQAAMTAGFQYFNNGCHEA